VGLLLIGTAAILLATLRAPGGDGGITWRIALVVGCAQALAVLPGISRSGATIATALLLGVGRPRAAEFSFLASVPLILGSVVLEVPELRTGPAGPGVLVAGFVTSFAVGVLALRWLVGLVRRGRLHWFAPYCLAVGAAAVIWSRIR
jgi:undecaprenyl-diphosphatase